MARVAVAGLLLLSACGGPTVPTVVLDTGFVLALGETTTIAATAVSVRFVEVLGDSRCPVDAACILGGNAIVSVEASPGTAPAVPLDLRTADRHPV